MVDLLGVNLLNLSSQNLVWQKKDETMWRAIIKAWKKCPKASTETDMTWNQVYGS